MEDVAVDVLRLVGGQPGDHGRDVVRAAAKGDGGAGADAPGGAQLAGLVGDAGGHAGGGAGRDGVGGHPVAAHVAGHHAGEAGDAVLGRPVVGLSRVAVQPGGGAEGDDAAGTLLAEQHRGVLDHGEGALEVDGDNVVPFLFGHVEHHAVAQDASHGDHDVQLAEAVEGGLDDFLAALHAGDVLGAGDGLAPRLAYLGDHHVGDRQVGAGAVDVDAQVADHHFRAFLGHQAGHAATDAPSGSGYNRYLILKQVCHCFASPLIIGGFTLTLTLPPEGEGLSASALPEEHDREVGAGALDGQGAQLETPVAAKLELPYLCIADPVGEETPFHLMNHQPFGFIHRVAAVIGHVALEGSPHLSVAALEQVAGGEIRAPLSHYLSREATLPVVHQQPAGFVAVGLADTAVGPAPFAGQEPPGSGELVCH